MSSYTWPQSVFARNLAAESGIVELMDDLGQALATGGGRVRMMGGGNPAHISEMETIWRERMRELLEEPSGEFDRVLGDYDPPVGNPAFCQAVAEFLNREYGWPITAENVAVTNGGQTAFFFLLNRFAGLMPDGGRKRILLPLVPEYIGYGDQGVSSEPLFDARRPQIEEIDDRSFKYHIDFDQLHPNENHGAITVSRPTNPSSNVLSDVEMARLHQVARAHGLPLIVDNAYGLPFPGVIFTEATPYWDEDIILTMSLSKLGLPGARTGIVIARQEIVSEIRAMTSNVGLANNNLGQALVRPLLLSGRIRQLVEQVIRPYYYRKAERALALAHDLLPDDIPWRIHKNEGAFFLWLWFPGLPIDSRTLYQKLKMAGLVVVPGRPFFFGLDTSDWSHAEECIRISYTQPEEVVADGFRKLAEVLRRLTRDLNSQK